MNPILSIIIPCYNSEATLETTLQSVINQSFQNWEALIINDGSSDNTEKIALKWVSKDNRFKYYVKNNEGLGKTRNYGIERSKGVFILPLDSDNQITIEYTEEAIDIFEKNKDIGVVYGNAAYFGQRTGLWKVDEYNFEKILAGNYIDACAIFKKEFWIKVGGYDENMPHQGHEDWDLWLAFGVLKVKFYHLNKITFKYYVSNNSMIRSFSETMEQLNNDYIFNKYSKQYQKSYNNIYSLFKNNEKKYNENLKSEKFIIDLFCKTFLKFTIFKK